MKRNIQFMRIALSQINSKLANFEYNQKKIIQEIQSLAGKKAELIVFPEAVLFGYHPFDLLERKKLIDHQVRALNKILKFIPKNCYVLIGGFEPNVNQQGRPYYNSAFLCTHKKVVKTFKKELLPTGDVFDEARFIEKGNLKNNFFKIKNKTFFITICEDIWAWGNKKSEKSEYSKNPLLGVPKRKIDLVINMSASPFHLEKDKQRLYVTTQTARHFKAPVLYVNLVGAQDEIIYDGRSFLIDQKGEKQFELSAFEEDQNVFDLETFKMWSSVQNKKLKSVDLLRKALVLGIKDFTNKTGLKKVHLGLSGGIDSALVACLAVDAVGPQNVSLFALPTVYNSKDSFDVAVQLSKNIGINLQTIPIQPIFENIQESLKEHLNIKEFSVVHENLQSRIRGLLMMAVSNHTGSLLLTTGNKTELACGYATLYGDMCGGLAPIGDLTKKQVYDLCRLYNLEHEVIPNYIISRPPSAELRPNQKDQDSLPEYDMLDKAVVQIVEKKALVSSKVEKWLYPVLMRTEFKRWQAPPVLKVTAHSFGRGRRYPIAHSAIE